MQRHPHTVLANLAPRGQVRDSRYGVLAVGEDRFAVSSATIAVPIEPKGADDGYGEIATLPRAFYLVRDPAMCGIGLGRLNSNDAIYRLSAGGVSDLHLGQTHRQGTQ